MAGQRRLQTTALVLPVFGAILIVPPFLGVFNLPVTVFGMPIVAIYLFSVWTGLIVVTAAISRRLGRDETGSDTQGDGDPPP